ncbi:ATP synthase F1 subunit epsilon [Candidatus Gottesmanbacteria bacterium]|nr:ATP synthase F1 subunit epsilon [Candidatus Gottesmanbacteria bacterium]
MKQFFLSIVTPQREAFAQEVTSVSVPSTDGRLTILPHHAKLFASLSEGAIKISQEGKEQYLAIGGGFIEVGNNSVTILVSRAVHAHELNEAEIEKAKKSAQELLAKSTKGAEREEAMAMLRRSMLELKLSEHIKHRHGVS